MANHQVYPPPPSEFRGIRGVMHVEVLRASGIKVRRMIGYGSRERYVIIRYGHGHGRKSMTSQVHHGGNSTMWNVTFVYNIISRSVETPTLQLEIWKKHKSRDDHLVGFVSVANLHRYISQSENLCTPYLWLPVFYKGEKDSTAQQRGEILVRFFFEAQEESYFGDNRHRDDHFFPNAETKSVDIVVQGVRAKYTTLDTTAGTPSHGALISLK
ncbi:hypothetical protein R1sor_024443 [Riccia sorocarpa]|uniref:C2 domain-containing protein n=1 Tax=Riccia sorocarpa TaxID=122646 RepID=A0ABD3GTI4_9MARC